MQATIFQNLLEALETAPADRLFATMWYHEDRIESVTFEELRRAARRQAAQLQALGLAEGDTVVLIMPQGIPLMTAFVGAMLAGGIPAILAYPNFKVEPAKYRFGLEGVSANLNARLVVVDQEFPEQLVEHIRLRDDSRIVRLQDQSESEDERVFSPVEVSAESLAFIQHSAGTTGLQKGVALSHGAVLRQLEHLVERLRIADHDRIYSWLPLYHDMGLIACFILPLVYHIPVVMQSPTDWVIQPRTMLELISQFRCTLAWTPNFALQFLARRVRTADRSNLDLSSLRALINCSEPVRAQSIDEFCDAYVPAGLQPNALQASYAMAENVFAVTQSTLNEPAPRIWVDGVRLRSEHVAHEVASDEAGSVCLVSSGRLLAENEVRIESSLNQTLGDGEIGEICIKGDSLFDGYYNRPDLTVAAMHDGFFRTGDLGFCLRDELYVIGRKKDLIIIGGKNIYPQDVEEIVYRHDQIRDGRAVSMGLFNSSLGTEDMVIVAEVNEQADLEHSNEIERALKNAIIAELGVAARSVYLKPPRWIVKSTAGKPARSHTREKLLAEHPELTEGN